MADQPPPPQACPARGCNYNTPINVPTWELVLGLMNAHNQAAHPVQAPQAGHGHPGGGDQGASGKLDKRPRPQATTDMSEHDFKFFENEWTLYKRATNLTGQTLIDELYSTMSDDLRKLAFDQGDVSAINTEAAMMERIKSLAVSVLHAAVHTVTLHEAEQSQGESVKTFAARVRGIAANCALEIQCTADGCTQMVNYTEATVYHVVLAGLLDRDLQARCTAQALLGHITDINTLVAYCTAEESSKISQAGTVASVRKSSYKKQKAGAGGQGTSRAENKGCYHCGAHHSGYSAATRAKECKAFKADCSNCGKTGHYARFCKGEKKSSGRIDEVKEQEQDSSSAGATGTNNLIEFSFFTIETANKYEVLGDNIPDRERWPDNTRHHGRQGDKGWRRSTVPGRGRRKPRPPQQPVRAPEWVGGQVSVIQQPPAQIPIAHMVYDYDKGWQQATIMT